jgi:hypothetical protein
MTLMRSTLLAAALSLAAGSAFAGDVTTARISEALSPKVRIRWRPSCEKRETVEDSAYGRP